MIGLCCREGKRRVEDVKSMLLCFFFLKRARRKRVKEKKYTVRFSYS